MTKSLKYRLRLLLPFLLVVSEIEYPLCRHNCRGNWGIQGQSPQGVTAEKCERLVNILERQREANSPYGPRPFEKGRGGQDSARAQLLHARAGRAKASAYLVFEWHMLGGNPQHTNLSEVSFSSLNLSCIWEFNLSEHIWRHVRRRSVWSSQPVCAKVGNDTLLFIGTYTRSLYCLNAKSGKEVWRFITGGAINSAPCFVHTPQGPRIIAASCDRIIYCLDAKTGNKIWNYEIYPWTFTVFEAITSSPIAVEIDGTMRILIGTWYSDRRPFKNVQSGEILCLDIETGKQIWRRTVSPTHLFTPAFAEINGNPLLFIAGADGNLYCVSAQSGQVLWEFTSSTAITSSPLVAQIEDKPVVIFGTLFGLLYCIDAHNGGLIWKYKTGMQVSSTGAVGTIEDKNVLFVPSYDRFLYCLDIASGKPLWHYETKQHLSSSPVIAKINNCPCVIFGSLDNMLYILDAKNGGLLWKYQVGSRLWAYETRGETLWPSPIAVALDDEPMLIVPWYDGKIYAFTDATR